MAAPTRISADAAAALVRPGDWVDYGFGLGQPDLFDRALAARSAELRGVKIRACLTLRPRAVLEADPHGRALPVVQLALLRLRPPAARRRPLQLHPDELRRGARTTTAASSSRVDVACIKTCPMDEHGYFNFGGAVTYQKAMTERAKIADRRDLRGACPTSSARRRRCTSSEVDYVIDGDGELDPRAREPAADRRRPQGRAR